MEAGWVVEFDAVDDSTADRLRERYGRGAVSRPIGPFPTEDDADRWVQDVVGGGSAAWTTVELVTP